MSPRTVEDAAEWTASGTQSFIAATVEVLDHLDDDSLLPGWDRRTVVAHVVGNARALLNLVRWARTGEPCPMYASPERRAADIAETSRLDPPRLLGRVIAAAQQLRDDFEALPPAAREMPVVTAAGRTVPASEVLWLRAREVNVHAVDLRSRVTFADLPPDFLRAVCGEAASRHHQDAGRPLCLSTPAGERWTVSGQGEALPISGALEDIAAYLTGRPHDLRSAGGLPAPPLGPWL